MEPVSTNHIKLEPQELEPLSDEVTVALEAGLAQLARGEIVTLNEANARVREVHAEWLRTRGTVANETTN